MNQSRSVASDISEASLSPKSLFLGAAFLSFLFSVYLWFTGESQAGLFVGLWVPSICSAGLLILKGGRHD